MKEVMETPGEKSRKKIPDKGDYLPLFNSAAPTHITIMENVRRVAREKCQLR